MRRALLTAERPALNFLQLLSGVATSTRHYVHAIEGASPNPRGCAILDTRKTIPGLRQAQKYAVRTGGGANQRLALWDGILIKENHVAAAGGIAAAIGRAVALERRRADPGRGGTPRPAARGARGGRDSVLLDNFTLEQVREAVSVTAGRALLEVSGGVTLDGLREIAATGVDRISVGGADQGRAGGRLLDAVRVAGPLRPALARSRPVAQAPAAHASGWSGSWPGACSG